MENKNKTVVLFYDKSKLFLEDGVYDVSKQKELAVRNGTDMKIQGNPYPPKSIFKILSEKDYYAQYPQDRPREMKTAGELFGGQDMGFNGVIKSEKREENIKLMIKGLKGMITRENVPKGNPAWLLLAKMEERLNELRLQKVN